MSLEPEADPPGETLYELPARAVAEAVAATPPPGAATAGPAAARPAEISFAGASPVMVGLSYLWVLCIVPLLAEPHDRAVRWHALHGLVLLIAETIGWPAVLILGAVAEAVLPAAVLAPLDIVRSVLGPAVLVLHAVLIVDGVRGRAWRLPLITPYVERILGTAGEPTPRAKRAGAPLPAHAAPSAQAPHGASPCGRARVPTPSPAMHSTPHPPTPLPLEGQGGPEVS